MFMKNLVIRSKIILVALSLFIPSCNRCNNSCAVKLQKERYFGNFIWIDGWIIDFHDCYFLKDNNHFLVFETYLNHSSQEEKQINELIFQLTLKSLNDEKYEVTAGIDEQLFSDMNKGIGVNDPNFYFGAYYIPFFMGTDYLEDKMPARIKILINESQIVDLGEVKYREK